jgi:bla regulator protein BlaR1
MSSVLATLNSSAGAAIAALLNSFWLALGVVALVWVALRFLPRLNAATRYVIWWAVLGVVLVLPLAPRLAGLWRSRQQDRVAAAKPAASPKVTLLPPVSEPAVVTVEQKRVGTWPLWAFGAWAAILLFRLGQIGRSWIFLSGVKRRASVATRALPDCGVARPVRLLLSRDVESPMAVGFLEPAVILPESVVDQLEAPELDHVLLHEMAHIARLDDWTNLAARLAGAALALHPVALWILRQIEREREMACDDFVVAQTGSARPYAESLARLFEMRWAQKGEALASGIFGGGSRVGERIELLLRRGREFSPRVSLKRVASSGLVLLGFVAAAAMTPRWIAFAQQEPKLSFEVATVKPADPNSPYSFRQLPGGRWVATNVPLRDLIASAYAVPTPRMAGGPGWLDSDRFTIDAKPAAPLPPWPESNKQLSLMLQSLLEDRFKLAVHWEKKEAAVYDLVAAKGGPKLKEADADEKSGFGMERGRIKSLALPLGYLASNLAYLLGRPVNDKTGLSGNYDYTLAYTPDAAQAAAVGPPGADAAPPPDPNGPSIFTALQEQLGLRLESAKGPVEVLVIDHAERPDAN